MLIASNFLLWVVVILLVVALAALAQQVGALRERIAPTGALVADGGPRENQPAPVIVEKTADGQVITLGGASEIGRTVLMMFVAPDCPICKKLIPLAMIVARAERLRLVFIGDGEPDAIHEMIKRHKIAPRDFVKNAQVGLAYQVGELPHAVLIRPDGTIAARGLVNSREHLESLLANGTGSFPAQPYPKSKTAHELRA